MSHPRLLPACLVLTIGLFAGCGAGHDRKDVAGTVNVGGTPLAEGTIQFFTRTEPPTLAGGALVKDGEYEMRGAQGLAVGEYVVRLSSVEVIGEASAEDLMMGTAEVESRERILPEYNTESRLTVTIVEEPRPYNFDIAGGAPPPPATNPSDGNPKEGSTEKTRD